MANGASLNAKSVLDETPLGESSFFPTFLILFLYDSVYVTDFPFPSQTCVLMRRSGPNSQT